MKVFFLSIFLMAAPLAMANTDATENLDGKTVTITVEQFLDLHKAKSTEESSQSQGVYSCVAGLKQSTEDRMDRELENLEKQVENLNGVAKARLDNRTNLREKFQEAWRKYQQKQLERDEKKSRLANDLRQAELNYQKALNEIRRQCREQANTEFAEYRKRVQRQAAVVAPHELHGFNNRINSYRRGFYENCYRSPENVQAMQIASKQLTLNIDKANTEMKIEEDTFQSFHTQTAMIQKDTLRNYEGQEELFAYNQALAQRITAKASFINTSKSKSQKLLNAIACIQPKGGASLRTIASPKNNPSSSGTPSAY